jgi:hypothetical protein
MKTLAIALFVAALPAFGWEKVCTFTFDKKYDGVRLGKVKVYRERDRGAWSYAVGLSSVKVSGHSCNEDERLTAYVGAKVKSSTGGFLDTGDLKVRGKKAETYWKIFDSVYLKDCKSGAKVWTSWACEKVIEPPPSQRASASGE